MQKKKTKKSVNSSKYLKSNRLIISFIFIILFESIVMSLTQWSLINFFILLAVGLLAIGVFYSFIFNQGKQTESYKKKNSAYIKSNIKSHEENSFINKNTDSRLVKLNKKNFNWSIDKVSRAENEQNDEIEEEAAEVKAEPIKMVPYHSPFDPIHPVENAEVDMQVNNDTFISEDTATDSFYSDKESEKIISAEIEDVSSYVDEMAAIAEEHIMDAENYDSVNVLYKEDRKIDSGAKVVKLPFRFKQPISKPLDDMHMYESRSGEYPKDMIYEELPVDLLNKSETDTKDDNIDIDTENELDVNSKKLIDTLASFGVGAKIINISQGPSVTRYELQPNAGVKVSRIVSLADDIALNLAATGVRIEAPIPGKAAVGIEVPNKEVKPVRFRDVIETDEFRNHQSKLAFAVGKDVSGKTIVGDIAKMPHLLIAGATGSGKSVCINTLIASILYKSSPEEVKLLMIDPKVVELGIYNGIPHLLIPVVTDPKKAAGALSWAVVEMTSRYNLFAENNVRDLKGYNAYVSKKGSGNPLPQIIIIIDELADLMMAAPNEVEDCICRLAQMARAAGMHLVIATQRPSVDVITGVIKANIPSRISFAVSSQIDSRTILDMAGAEKLLGRGDMLFNPVGEPKPIRVQGGFISDNEVEAIVNHLKSCSPVEYDQEILDKINNQAEPQQIDSDADDELLPQAIDMVLDIGQASTSLIQRKFKVGYSRAARIMDQMEAWGVVSKQEGSKPRQILITRQEWEELNS